MSMSFPAIAEMVSSAVFAGGGGVVADAAPLADVGTVTVGVSVLTDAGSELPAASAGAAAVRVAPLAEAGEVTLDVVGLDVAELLYQTDSDDELPPTVTQPITVNGVTRPSVVPVVMVKSADRCHLGCIAFRWIDRTAQMTMGRSTGSFWNMTGTVL